VFMAKEHEQAAIYDAKELKRLVALTIDIIIHITAEVICDDAGKPLRKQRKIEEISFDPLAKLRARFGEAEIQRG
jgi:type IV secretion system protein VirB11